MLECPDETLMGLYYMLEKKKYRQSVLMHSKDSVIENFWLKSFERCLRKNDVR